MLISVLEVNCWLKGAYLCGEICDLSTVSIYQTNSEIKLTLIVKNVFQITSGLVASVFCPLSLSHSASTQKKVGSI